jgi:hypothetical protein
MTLGGPLRAVCSVRSFALERYATRMGDALCLGPWPGRSHGFAATREHIVRALTKELLIRRTMTGAEIDEVIAAAVAARSVENERQRRAAWKRIEESAARFVNRRGPKRGAPSVSCT